MQLWHEADTNYVAIGPGSTYTDTLYYPSDLKNGFNGNYFRLVFNGRSILIKQTGTQNNTMKHKGDGYYTITLINGWKDVWTHFKYRGVYITNDMYFSFITHGIFEEADMKDNPFDAAFLLGGEGDYISYKASPYDFVCSTKEGIVKVPDYAREMKTSRLVERERIDSLGLKVELRRGKQYSFFIVEDEFSKDTLFFKRWYSDILNGYYLSVKGSEHSVYYDGLWKWPTSEDTYCFFAEPRTINSFDPTRIKIIAQEPLSYESDSLSVNALFRSRDSEKAIQEHYGFILYFNQNEICLRNDR